MSLNVRIITGPPATKLSKAAATKALKEHPDFPKGATYELENVEGRWVAAIASTKKAEFPPSGGEEPSGPPAPEAPAETPEVPSEDGPPSDEGGEDKPKGDKPKGEKGEKGELAKLEHMLTTLLTALGIDPAGVDANPVPGLDGGPPAPGGDLPPDGLGGPPPGGPVPDSEGKTHTIHERAMKPGEAQPGSTPVGAPAFASVRDDHPWKGVLGTAHTFKIDEPIGDMPVADVSTQLQALAAETGGYRVQQINVVRDESGQRTAHALVVRT